MPAAKYFIAIVLPEPLFSKVEGIKQKLFGEFGLKGALLCPAHITLHRPFEWKEEKEHQLIETLKRFRPETAFELNLHNFGFFEPRVIYVDVIANAELQQLHAQLVRFAKKELHLFNEAEDLRGFHPHATVAFRDLKKPLFYELKQSYLNKTFEGKFQCKTISLMKRKEKWEVLHSFDI